MIDRQRTEHGAERARDSTRRPNVDAEEGAIGVPHGRDRGRAVALELVEEIGNRGIGPPFDLR